MPSDLLRRTQHRSDTVADVNMSQYEALRQISLPFSHRLRLQADTWRTACLRRREEKRGEKRTQANVGLAAAETRERSEVCLAVFEHEKATVQQVLIAWTDQNRRCEAWRKPG